MVALELTELNRVDDEADVPMTREPRGVMLIVGFGAVADAGLLHIRVAADIQDRRRLPRELLRHIQIRRDVEAGHRLVVELLDKKLRLLLPAGDDGLEV